ncbi:hypothetical protein RYX36_035918 [Vicia faba]
MTNRSNTVVDEILPISHVVFSDNEKRLNRLKEKSLRFFPSCGSFQQYSEMIDFESSIPLMVVPQFNDGLFHDDVDFAIPLKPSDQIVAGFLCCEESEFQSKSVSLLWGIDSPSFKIHFSLTNFTVDVAVDEKKLPKRETWSVHKFGGTCVESSGRINNVAGVIISDDSERKLVAVSAMSKVTDIMYDLIHKAQSQDKSYISTLDVVEEKHSLSAHELFDGVDLATFLANLHQDIRNLKAMLHAIDIVGHATEYVTDLVVGHGELWYAQILSYVFKKKGTDCIWMDTRQVLIVNSTSADQVDPDDLEFERRLNKWYSLNSSKVIIATGFIASTRHNIPTTLKRDGSDFLAAIMAALFRARQVTIWTDVAGVYSVDPRKVSEVVILKTLSYREASKMSYFGANFLHPRTISPIIRYGIPVIIRNISIPLLLEQWYAILLILKMKI